METDHAMTSDLTTVPLLVRRVASIDLDRALSAFDDLGWLGPSPEEPSDQPGLRQIQTDLDLPILDGSSKGPVHKATLIDVGPARRVGDRVIVEIDWRSSTFAPLFPVFAGKLRVAPDAIELDGRYAPPLGTIGLLLDQAILHFVARRTAGALLARLAAQFESGSMPEARPEGV